jgi:site-specific recombinase XerD
VAKTKPKIAPPLPADWEAYWTDFELLKGRSLSPRTLENYRDTLSLLGRFLEPKPPTLASLTRRQLAEFLDHCLASTSASTTGMRYRGLAAWFNWLAKPGEDDEPFLESNPMKGLRAPKDVQKPVAVLSQEDVRRLIAACRGPEFENRRDEALIRFMHDTGCRRGEVASMQVTAEWLNLKQGTAMVTGKTGPRVIAFGPSAGAALYRYVRLRQRHAARNETALWIGHKGPLQGNGIYQLLKRRFALAGVTASKRAHVFRHTFSHEWQAAGGSVPDLVALNGWRGPAMAYRYGNSVAAERARESHKRLSPGERL